MPNVASTLCLRSLILLSYIVPSIRISARRIPVVIPAAARQASLLEKLASADETDCPPDGDKCCPMGDRWQTAEFVRQILGLGVEGCFQANLDLSQAFAVSGLYVPIQIVFAVRGVYDFGLGAGTSGNVVQLREEAERRKFTGEISAAVQITVIPKTLYIYVSLNYKMQASQKHLKTHPYILPVKEMVALTARLFLGEKYLSMRFSEKPSAQRDFVASLLDMYTFTHGFPTDDPFLDRFDALIEEASRHMTWPKSDRTYADLKALDVSTLRGTIYGMAKALQTNYVSSFFSLKRPKALFDCYSYYEAMMDVVYGSNIALTGENKVSYEELEAKRRDRDAANNRDKNETFAGGFTSGGEWFSSRGKYKRVNTDPLFLCDRHKDSLKCQQHLALCMSLNYKPTNDFIAPEMKGEWPNQVLNSFPEVVDAVNKFETLYMKRNGTESIFKALTKRRSTTKNKLVIFAMDAIRKLGEAQPTFVALYRAREGSINECLVRECVGEEQGSMIVDELEDDLRGGEKVEKSMASEVKDLVDALISGPWSSGLPKNAFYYTHAAPPQPGRGLGNIVSCSGGLNCKSWRNDVSMWTRLEETLWRALNSGDARAVEVACAQRGVKLHADLRNPFEDSMTLLTKARRSRVEGVIRACPNFQTSAPKLKKSAPPIDFRAFVVQRLWMRTVAQAHLAIEQYHRELSVEAGHDASSASPEVAKAFHLEYSSTVSFVATLDVSYIDFCKGTGAPVAFEGGVTRSGTLVHEFSPEKGTYVLNKEDDPVITRTKKFQFVNHDGSVKFFAEWGEGTKHDDFDLVDLTKIYTLQMSTPLMMTAFAGALGLSPLLNRLSPLVSRTLTGQVVEASESEGGLTFSNLQEVIVRAWEKQAQANASSAITTWFEDKGEKLLRASQSGMTCDLGLEAVASFLFRMVSGGNTVGHSLGRYGAQKAKDLYETAPVYAGAWFTGRLDMLVSHTPTRCHKMLRPMLRAFFRAGFNAPFFSGAFTASAFIRISLPLTPKAMTLPHRKGGKLVRRKWCGVLGNPG